MRKITFLLTLLLMYVGVTPMMASLRNFTCAELDESKVYTIMFSYDTYNNKYVYIDGNNILYEHKDSQPIDDEKYHFKFVKAETSRDNVQLYRIQPANSTSSYVYNNANGSNAKISSNSSSYETFDRWFVFVGDGGDQCIMHAQYNDEAGAYVRTKKYWFPSISAESMYLWGESTASSPDNSKLRIVEVPGLGGESGGNEGGNEGGGNEGESTIDYTPNFTGQKTRTTRLVTSFAVNNDTYNLTYQEQLQSYVDKTSTKTFTVEAGSIVVLNMDEAGAQKGWMNAYVYIDADKDGFEAGINGNWQPTGDLVSYSFYSNSSSSDESGYNSAGSGIFGNDRSTLYLPSFTAPSNPGVYRIRAKYDWCNIDPNGGQGTYFGGTFTSHGGAIADFTLVVTPKKEPINLTLAQISDTDELLYGLKGYIGSFSAPYATLIPNGVEAYYATSNDNLGYITLTPCKATGTSAKGVPANFGVILVSQSQNITMEPTSSNVDTPANAFDNSASKAVVMGDNCYVLANGADGIGFYLATKGTTLKAGKAYIQLSNSSQTSALRLVLDETVTGINGVATEKVDAPIHDLSGRRVLNTVKGGIYIQNGKKFIVK